MMNWIYTWYKSAASMAMLGLGTEMGDIFLNGAERPAEAEVKQPAACENDFKVKRNR